MNKLKVAFIDRDGVVLNEPDPDQQIDSLAKYKILPKAVEALQDLQKAGYTLVMVSNQNGIGLPHFPEESFRIPHEKMISDLAAGGVKFYKIYVCPHMPEANCECRKPKIGLVKELMAEVDLENSLMIGDRDTDVEFSVNLGIKGYKILRNTDGLYQAVTKILT
ncbi:MAG: histidinol-phosphatase [Patescibacteria group bacterium]